MYLGEDNIKVVLGKPRERLSVKTCRTYELPKGTLINDVITDDEAFEQTLRTIGRDFRRYAGEVHLVLGSNKIITRVLKVPSLPNAVLMETARKELKGYLVKEEEDMVYDYGRIDAETILCAAVRRSMLEEYSARFRQCRLRLKSVSAALDSVTAFAQRLPLLKGNTFILVILDGRNMISSLYIGGVYIYTSRLRLLAERGTEETCSEMLGQMASVKSFAENRYHAGEITSIYLCGLKEEEEQVLYPMVKEDLDVNACALELYAEEPGENLQAYLYAAGGLLARRRARKLDLLAASRSRGGDGTKRAVRAAAAGLVPLTICSCFLFRAYENRKETEELEKEMARMKITIGDPEVKAENSEVAKLQGTLMQVQARQSGLEKGIEYLDQYKEVDGSVFSILWAPEYSGITVTDLRFDRGTFSFTAVTPEVSGAYELAREMEESGIFESVEYQKMEQSGSYRYYVECRFGWPSEGSGS